MPESAALFTDPTTAERIRAGDKDTFGHLFKASYARLYRFALGYVHNHAIAEDILSDVFLRLWANRETFRPTGSIELYLYGAVRNSILQYFRDTAAHDRRHERALQKSVIPGMGDMDSHDDNTHHDDNHHDDDRHNAIWRIIAEMPEQRRMVMMLRWRDQKSFADIAEILGISRPAAQMQVDRALKALRKLFVPQSDL